MRTMLIFLLAAGVFSCGGSNKPSTQKSDADGGDGITTDSTNSSDTTLPDTDNDNVPDNLDNCLNVPNTDQANNDQDAAGDACDSDDDNDGDADVTDCAPIDAAIFHGAVEECDGVDNNCNNQVNEGCGVAHCGTISASETWGPVPFGHHVTCSVVVEGAAAPVLTIAQGAIVYFAEGTSLRVGVLGAGDVIVENALLTSDAANLQPGHWGGVSVGALSSTLSSVSGGLIEYAGAGSVEPAGLRLDGATLTSDIQLVSRFNLGSGVLMRRGANATFTNSDLSDNERYGLDADSASLLSGPITTTTFSGNGEYALLIEAADAYQLDPTSSYSGNTKSGVALSGAVAIATNATWNNLNAPYVVLNDIEVEDVVAPVLTIAAGTQVLFRPGAGLSVGDNDMGDLVVAGSPSSSVYFGPESQLQPGAWDGLFLGPNTSVATDLQWFDVEYAGGSVEKAGITLYTGLANLGNCSLTNNRGTGLFAFGSTFSISNCSISGTVPSTPPPYSDGDGVVVDESPGGDIVSFLNNTISANSGYPLVIPANDMVALDTASTFAGNTQNYVFVSGGAAFESGNWPCLDAPWRIGDDIYIDDGLNHTLITMSDCALYFEPLTTLKIGDQGLGDFQANNVSFLSISQPPTAGDWWGLVFGVEASSQSSLTDCTVSHAGHIGADSNTGNIYLYDSPLGGITVANCAINNSQSYGIFCQGGCTAYETTHGDVLQNNTYAGNAGDTN